MPGEFPYSSGHVCDFLVCWKRDLCIAGIPIMEFFETVEKRASYRNAFAAQEIPEEDIRKIVTAGLHRRR